MDLSKRGIHLLTFLLAWVAGYCDTVTFVAGDAVFSAHVTGNFIVFAAQAVSGNSSFHAWSKLFTFPIFVAAVIAGGWMASRAQKKNSLLMAESVVLLISGLTALVLPVFWKQDDLFSFYFIIMMVVFAMGLQNAFGKLFAKETHGPTTMMTGNVTQAALDLGNVLRKGFVAEQLSWQSLRKQVITIGGFLLGCLLGALLSKWMGLGAIVLPGLALFLFRMLYHEKA